MPIANDAVIEARRNNIFRYHRLLQTRLTDIERSYLRSRLAEEETALLSRLEQSERAVRDEGLHLPTYCGPEAKIARTP